MTQAEKSRYRKSLETKRTQVTDEIREFRERLGIARTGDTMDQARRIADRDLTMCAIDRMSAVLRLVERALQELRAGTFGICVRCHKQIRAKRLEAVPWSPHCVSCQERLEQSDLREAPAEAALPYALAS